MVCPGVLQVSKLQTGENGTLSWQVSFTRRELFVFFFKGKNNFHGKLRPNRRCERDVKPRWFQVPLL